MSRTRTSVRDKSGDPMNSCMVFSALMEVMKCEVLVLTRLCGNPHQFCGSSHQIRSEPEAVHVDAEWGAEITGSALVSPDQFNDLH